MKHYSSLLVFVASCAYSSVMPNVGNVTLLLPPSADESLRGYGSNGGKCHWTEWGPHGKCETLDRVLHKDKCLKLRTKKNLGGEMCRRYMVDAVRCDCTERNEAKG